MASSSVTAPLTVSRSALTGIWFSFVGAQTTSTNLVIEGNTIFDEASSSGVLLNEIFTNVSIKGNTFNGTPVNHIHLVGTSSSGISIVGNDFIGTPSTRVITHSSTSTGVLTNVLIGNRFEVGSTHSFQAIINDFIGTEQNYTGGDEAASPSAFPPGISRTRISARSIDGSTQTGLLETHILNTNGGAYFQRFIPDYSAGFKSYEYIRKAVDTSNWDSWWRVTGSAGPSVTTTAVGNVGGGEDSLNTYSLAADTLSANGKGVLVTAWGTTANNANPKTVKLYFGSVAILTTALTVSQVGTWRIRAEVYRTGTDAQDYTSQLIQGGTATLLDVEGGTLTQDDGATITIKCTGTVTDGGGGINNDDIVQEGMLVETIN